MSVFSPESECSAMLAMSTSPLSPGECGWDGAWKGDCAGPLSPAAKTILYHPPNRRVAGAQPRSALVPSLTLPRSPAAAAAAAAAAGNRFTVSSAPESASPFEKRSQRGGETRQLVHSSARVFFPPHCRNVAQREQRSQIRALDTAQFQSVGGGETGVFDARTRSLCPAKEDPKGVPCDLTVFESSRLF